MIFNKTWFLLCLFSIALVLFLHYFLQLYLFMNPCANCVYIRFAICVFALGAFLLIFGNKFAFLAFAMLFYALFLGFKYSFLLNESYEAIANANPFGVTSCPSELNFIFSLPLDKIFPSLFTATGTCGMDAPIVPEFMSDQLSKIQEFFVGTKEANFTNGLYSKAWFLIPKFEFINMAQGIMICLVFFSFFVIKDFIILIKNSKAKAVIALFFFAVLLIN